MWHSCSIKESSEAQRETVVSMCLLVHLENNVLSPHRRFNLELISAKEKNNLFCWLRHTIKTEEPRLPEPIH